MNIYNYLFYKTFLLSRKSGNFEDMPVLGGLLYVSLCAMFNIFAIILFIEGVYGNNDFYIKNEYKYPLAFIWVVFLIIFYSYKGRYKRIIEYYEEKEKNKLSLHPIIVILIYYGFSALLLFLAGAFKNRIWIFS